MHQFSKRVFLFLLMCFFYTVSGRIVPDFSECNNFFYHGIPPTGLSEGAYQPICQQYKNRYRFATLYSTISHAPLYSAYIVSPSNIPRTKDETWMYEPQLSNNQGDPEMQIANIKVEYKNQASLEDYRLSSFYTKGHLAPSQHLNTQEDKEATFTLTNIVPQRGGSNSGPWSDWEKEILEIKKYCTGDMYVITGGIPFTPEPKKMSDKVSIPEYMWSAYCCTVFQNNRPNDRNYHFPSYAAVGRNRPESPEDIVKKDPNLNSNVRGYDVAKKTLNELQGILQNKLNVAITLFDGNCQTVQD